MEEWVGEQWHRLITRVAESRHPQAAVRLNQVRHGIGLFFRALGGDAGLQLEASEATPNRARRRWLQKLAGADARLYLAWRDERALRLPPEIACFDKPERNRDLYYWLAALAAVQTGKDRIGGESDWLSEQQRLTRRVLQRYPGLRARYRRLLDAHLPQRPDASQLPSEEAAFERCIRAALREPGSVTACPAPPKHFSPVPLWLHPSPPVATTSAVGASSDEPGAHGGEQRALDDIGRRQAERVDEPDSDRGLVTVRMENIFTLGEFVNVDRGSEEEDDLERAETVARDLDRLSVSKSGAAKKAGLRFDLDLPAASEDDTVLSSGLRLPEWDWKSATLKPDRCHVVLMQADRAAACELPQHLQPTARTLRRQFQALAPARVWRSRLNDGQDIDLDAFIRYASDRRAGVAVSPDRLYRELRSGDRDLCCLLMADLSLSTDTWVDDHHRVIDVIRDSLYLFSESLAATGDRFALYGFSSRKRDPVRVHSLKTFDEPYNGTVRGRIEAIRPGYYTRLGAAVRYASRQLITRGYGRRLLLILTDGKPNDLDQYEGRYGIEDTREAVVAARRAGLLPFCVTIDHQGNEYLPHIFGHGAYVVIRKPQRLPQELPRLYALLTSFRSD